MMHQCKFVKLTINLFHLLHITFWKLLTLTSASIGFLCVFDCCIAFLSHNAATCCRAAYRFQTITANSNLLDLTLNSTMEKIHYTIDIQPIVHENTDYVVFHVCNNENTNTPTTESESENWHWSSVVLFRELQTGPNRFSLLPDHSNLLPDHSNTLRLLQISGAVLLPPAADPVHVTSPPV